MPNRSPPPSPPHWSHPVSGNNSRWSQSCSAPPPPLSRQHNRHPHPSRCGPAVTHSPSPLRCLSCWPSYLDYSRWSPLQCSSPRRSGSRSSAPNRSLPPSPLHWSHPVSGNNSRWSQTRSNPLSPRSRQSNRCLRQSPRKRSAARAPANRCPRCCRRWRACRWRPPPPAPSNSR